MAQEQPFALFIDIDLDIIDIDRISNLHRLGSYEIGSLNPKLVNHTGVIICSKNAFEYIENIAPDKRCYDIVGVQLKPHLPTKTILNFFAEKALPDVWSNRNCVPTIWYDSKIYDFGYLFDDYLADGIVLRPIPYTGSITRKQVLLAKSQLESFCNCFYVLTPIKQRVPTGDIGFKILTFGEGEDLRFDSKFFGFGSLHVELTKNILNRLERYVERWPYRRDEMFEEIMSDVNSKQIYQIKWLKSAR